MIVILPVKDGITGNVRTGRSIDVARAVARGGKVVGFGFEGEGGEGGVDIDVEGEEVLGDEFTFVFGRCTCREDTSDDEPSNEGDEED